MTDTNQEQIRKLMNEIYEGECEINQLAFEYQLDKKRSELKKLLVATVEPNNDGQHVIVIDRIRAIGYVQHGHEVIDHEKAKKLLHPNTLKAILKTTKDKVLLRIGLDK
jgi:hypothetical protein